MRLIKISAPGDLAGRIKDLAFECAITEVSISQADFHTANGAVETKDVLDIQTATNKARHFTTKLLAADFYDPEQISISTRSPLSIVSKEDIRRLTWPLVMPLPDILEEHWQFSHITPGFAGRIFIGGSLLAFGMINQQILIIIAALLFLPLLPLLLAVSFGLLSKHFRLAAQGAKAFLTATVILLATGIFVGALSQPPLKFDEFNSPGASMLISFAVGIAAVLAGVDDAGRRELIGLAATSQLAIVPVWFGVNFVFGFSPALSKGEIAWRAGGLVLNAVTILAASAATYIVTGNIAGPLKKLRDR
jgi:hypothetical protein